MNVAAVFRRQGSSNAWKDNSPVPTPSVSIIEGSVSTLLDENGREGKSRDGVVVPGDSIPFYQPSYLGACTRRSPGDYTTVASATPLRP